MCPTRCASWRRATRARSGPFTTAELSARYGVDMASSRCASSSAPASWFAASCAHLRSARAWASGSGATRRSCAACAARRWRCFAKRSSRPIARAGGFLPSWQGVDRHAAAGAGVERLREVLVPLQGLALPAELWERDVLPRRVGAYSTSGSTALRERRGRVGRRGLDRRSSGRVALYFRDDAPRSERRPHAGEARGAGRARARADPRSALRRARPCFFTDLLAEIDRRRGERSRRRCGISCGRARHQRRVGAAARAAARAGPLAAPPGAPRTRAPGGASHRRCAPRARRPARRCRAAGRSPSRRCLRRPRTPVGEAAHAGRAAARALRHPDPRAGARRGRPGRLRGAL
jgi:hypothetical protein